MRLALVQRDQPWAVGMSKSDRNIRSYAVRAGRGAVSSVKFSEELTTAIDAWAEAHRTTRSAAIRLLVELGLKATAPPTHRAAGEHDSLPIEALAVTQIVALLDPQLLPDERERRIRKLIDGPPEFSTERIDLPKHGK
jgi:hypothetical protein